MVRNLPTKARDAGDVGSIPGLGKCPRKGHGNPLQCSCLENPMDRGAWLAIAHGVTKSGHSSASERTHIPRIYREPGEQDGREGSYRERFMEAGKQEGYFRQWWGLQGKENYQVGETKEVTAQGHTWVLKLRSLRKIAQRRLCDPNTL